MERSFLNASCLAKSFSSFRNVLRSYMAPLAAFFLYFLHPALLRAGTTALGFLYSGEQSRFPHWLYGALAGALAVIIAVSAVALRFHYLNVALNDQMQLRDKAEEKLRKLSAAIIQSPVSIVITDTSGIIEYANPKFCELTGYT